VTAGITGQDLNDRFAVELKLQLIAFGPGCVETVTQLMLLSIPRWVNPL